MAPLLEAAMLVAFSISWYCSIWKMLRVRQAAGKSLGFVLLICFGYVCGIASKIALYRDTGVWSELILLYAWNLLVTAFDAGLVVHFTRRTPGHGAFLAPGGGAQVHSSDAHLVPASHAGVVRQKS